MRPNQLSVAAGVLVASFALSACVVRVDSEQFVAREEKRFTVKGAPRVELDTYDGSIEIRSWDRDEVLVEIEKRAATKELAEAIQVKADQDGNRIRVQALEPGSTDKVFGMMVNTARYARLVATVPGKCTLVARTGDGSISIERVAGEVELHTGDGSVRAYRIDGGLLVDTGDGSVKLEDVNGSIDVRTGDGSVTVEGQLAGVRVRTGDGSVTVRAKPASQVRDSWSLETDDGTVALYVPDGFSASLDAEAQSGVVRTDSAFGFPDREEASRHVLKASLGAGGPAIRLRSGDGSISIRRY